MDKQRTASGISGGIFLISLGVLLLTGWWWPGIMVAIGLSAGAELIFRGQCEILSDLGDNSEFAHFAKLPKRGCHVRSEDPTVGSRVASCARG